MPRKVTQDTKSENSFADYLSKIAGFQLIKSLKNTTWRTRFDGGAIIGDLSEESLVASAKSSSHGEI